jgi:hypothetical protein
MFIFTTASRPALEPTQPPIQWEPGALSLGVKQPRRRADHSPPSSAEIKNAWCYTSTPPYAFMAWCSVKAQGLTIFIFYDIFILYGCNVENKRKYLPQYTFRAVENYSFSEDM